METKTTVADKAKNIPQWSWVVKDRDGWKCQICGVDGPHIIAHHKDTSDGMRLIVSNGQTLCRSCHRKLDGNHEQKTNIQILAKTKAALKSIGKFTETYDDVISRLLGINKC